MSSTPEPREPDDGSAMRTATGKLTAWSRRKVLVSGSVVLALCLLVATALLETGQDDAPFIFTRKPAGIMGTDCSLTVVMEGSARDSGKNALNAAEQALRKLEALMSTKLEASEISRFNQAPAGREISLSPETASVLHLARGYAETTSGAFDVTCLPLIQLWRQSAEEGRLPASSAIQKARSQSDWSQIQLDGNRTSKLSDTAGVDLGGIAKGYAIDLAVEAMRQAGASGGMVDVGGDIHCFGISPSDGGWSVGILDPYKRKVFARLRLKTGAVATSGNYYRFFEINGKRYSHILDPRNGRPSDAAPSVTVAAPTAAAADAWATALSVLGLEGLASIPAGQGIEALVITGEPEDWSTNHTAGFPDLEIYPNGEAGFPALH